LIWLFAFPNGEYSIYMGTYGTDIQHAVVVQINAEMAAKGWKPSDLSREAGIPKNTLSRYLKGERGIPLDTFGDIAQALSLSYVELASRAQRRLKGEDVQ
jgi:transcriptional regulator with XRE-family HTH domain